MKHLIIIGAGGFGREIFNTRFFFQGYKTEFDIKGFLDDTENPLHGCPGYPPVVGTIKDYVPQPDDVFICALGSVRGKQACVRTILERGGEFISLIHKKCSISLNVDIGKGCIILYGVGISCDITIGDFTTIMDEVVLGHDVKIGPWCHLGCRAFVGGYATLGEGVTLHTYSIIQPKRRIGDYATVGAGCYACRNVKAGTTVYGNPAKVLK